MRTLEWMLNRLNHYKYDTDTLPSFMLYTNESGWVACLRNSTFKCGIGKTPYDACLDLIIYLKAIDMWGIEIDIFDAEELLSRIDDRSVIYNCFTTKELFEAIEMCSSIKEISETLYNIESAHMERSLVGDVTDATIKEARDFLKNFQTNLPKIIKQVLEER